MKVTVIDYGLSNLRSVANALARARRKLRGE